MHKKLLSIGEKTAAESLAKRIEATAKPGGAPVKDIRRLYNQETQHAQACADKVTAAKREVERPESALEDARNTHTDRVKETSKAEEAKKDLFSKLQNHEQLEVQEHAKPNLELTIVDLAALLKTDPSKLATEVSEAHKLAACDDEMEEEMDDMGDPYDFAVKHTLEKLTSMLKQVPKPRPQRRARSATPTSNRGRSRSARARG